MSDYIWGRSLVNRSDISIESFNFLLQFYWFQLWHKGGVDVHAIDLLTNCLLIHSSSTATIGENAGQIWKADLTSWGLKLCLVQPAFLINRVWQTQWSEQHQSRPTHSETAAAPVLKLIFSLKLPSLLPQAVLQIFEVLSVNICKEEEERNNSCLIRQAILTNRVRNRFPLSLKLHWISDVQRCYLHLFQSHHGRAAFRHPL